MAKTVLLHHPQIRKEIRRGRRLAALLIEQSGWRDGPLPAPEPVKPVKKAASANNSDTSTGTSGEGK